MVDFPYELVSFVLSYLPLCELTNKSQKVSKLWYKCAQYQIKLRLLHCISILKSTETDRDTLAELVSSLDLNIGDPVSDAWKEKPFSAWLLGNFEHSNDSQVVTGIQLSLSGFDVNTGMIIFKPTGNATFGMLVSQLGYIPITQPYSWPKFHFKPSISPTFKFWFHVESRKSHLHTNHFRSLHFDETIPKGTTKVVSEIGPHYLNLEDEIGYSGRVDYTIDSVGIQSSEGMETVSIGQEMIDYFEKEEQRINGTVVQVVISPQVLFAFPV